MLDVKKVLANILTWMRSKTYTGYGTRVDISSYTSANMYTIPSDGIIQAVCTYRANSYIIVYREDGIVLIEQATPSSGLQGDVVASAPVYKGMKVYTVMSSTYSHAYFWPYTT